MLERLLAWILLCDVIGFVLAQNTTTDATATPTPTSTLILSMPPTVTLCAEVVVNWFGGVPNWIFSWQLSKGAIGDESMLSEDDIDMQFNIDVVEPLSVYFYPRHAQAGDTIRFIMEDNWGEGQIVYAWSTIAANTTECDLQQGGNWQLHFPSGVTTTDDITTKEPVEIPTNYYLITNFLPVVTTRVVNGITLRTTTTIPVVQAATPNSVRVTGITGPTPTPNPTAGSSNAPNPNEGPIRSPATVNNRQDGGTESPYGGSVIVSTDKDDNVHTISSQTGPPPISNSADTTASHMNGHLSSKAIGIIVGSLAMAIILWIVFLLWRRRRTRERKALEDAEKPANEVRSMLSEEGLLPPPIQEQIRVPAPLPSKRQLRERVFEDVPRVSLPPPTEYTSTIPDTAGSIETASVSNSSDLVPYSTNPPTIVDPNSATRYT
ncbi:hypothetical protein CPB86DRAFT_811287 [Serendipita vermifera]|nr:hypothetical protein CPB86DRAFT_811287 [Serendipita vermifera]